MIRLVNTKMKDAEPPRRMTFELQAVDLGNGASSAVLTLCEASADKERELSKGQKLAKDAYVAAAAANGIYRDTEFIGLALDDWRTVFYAMHTGDTPDAKRKAFQRVRADLQAIGRITAEDDVYRWNDAAVALDVMFHRKSGTSGTVPDILPECPDAEAVESGTDGTNAYRHVPMSRTDWGIDEPCARCAGTGCAWCDR